MFPVESLSKKKFICFLLCLILFFTVFIWSFQKVTYILRDKSLETTQDNFAAIPRDSLDVVFIGSSHTFCSTMPKLLEEEYGIKSFDLATSAQTIPMSYYACMEAIELQHPKAIVLELLNCTNYAYTVMDEYTHSFFDAMPYCKGKKAGINDLVDSKDRIYYWLPIGLYHSRWKSLTESDYADVRNDLGGFFPTDGVSPMDEIQVYPEEDQEEIHPEMLEYLNKIITLCREQDVALYFYITPFNIKEDSDYEIWALHTKEANFNWLSAYAKEQGIPCLNLFHHIQQSGIDVSTDFKDHEHTNTAGAVKITRYLAEHLLSSYITK